VGSPHLAAVRLILILIDDLDVDLISCSYYSASFGHKLEALRVIAQSPLRRADYWLHPSFRSCPKLEGQEEVGSKSIAKRALVQSRLVQSR
jgi:hypothetical protein